ncbi:MAG: hypothetical protein RL117_104 [Verrucomicrobiota bacterium]|jgi:hypothetical protein
MGKLFILISILPIVVYWLSRTLLGDRVLAKSGIIDCRITGADYAKKLRYEGKLSRRLREGRTADVLAEISLMASYDKLLQEQGELVKWRIKVDLWGRLVVPLSIMVASFGILAGRPASLCIGMALLVNAVVAILKWTTRDVAQFAVEKAVALMKKSHIPRQEDEAELESCIRARIWR